MNRIFSALSVCLLRPASWLTSVPGERGTFCRKGEDTHTATTQTRSVQPEKGQGSWTPTNLTGVLSLTGSRELIKGHLALVAAGIPVDPSAPLPEPRLLQRMTRKKKKAQTKHQLED